MTQTKSRSYFVVFVRFAIAASFALFAFVCGVQLTRQATIAAEPNTANTPDLMKKKLVLARELLAGLAMEDYDQLVRRAQILESLTQQRWRSDETDEYRANLKVFRFATSELQRLATEKNLDGATLAYVQLTTSCVACHRQMRQKKM